MKKLLLLLLFIPAVVFAVELDFSKMTLTDNITSFTLANGLKVVVKEEPSIPLAGVSLIYRVGIRNEVKGKSGLTHLLEHMMFQASRNYPKGVLNRTFQEIGAQNNAYTSYEKTVYHEVCPPIALSTVLKMEADRMTGALLIPSEYEREKQVVLSEITKHEKNPSVELGRKLFPAVFGDHPLSFLYGYLDDVKNSTRDYTYNELYRKYYTPNNATLIIVGHVDAAKVKKMVTDNFGALPRSEKLPKLQANPIPFEIGVKVKVKGTASENFGEILFKLPGVNFSNTDFRTLMFIQISDMIGGFGYWPTIDGGVGFMGFSKDPIYPANVLDENYIRNNLEDFKTRVFAKELMDYDSIGSLMSTLVKLESTIGIEHYKDLFESFKNLSAEDVIRVVKTYLTSSNASVGYFIAKKYDRQAQPVSDSEMIDHFSADNQNPEKMKPAKLKKLQEINRKNFEGTKKLLKKYLADVQQTVLPNRLTVIYKPLFLNQKVSLAFGIRALKSSQVKQRQATETFHLIMQGGPQTKLENDLNKHGAVFKSSFSPNYVTTYGEFLKNDTESALKVIALMVKNRKFIPLVLEEDKFNAIRSHDLKEKNPSPDLHSEWNNLKQLYPKEGSGLDIWANSHDYLALSKKDIQDYYVSFYRPENAVLVIAGNLDWSKIKQVVNRELEGEWQKEKPVLKKKQVVFNTPSENETTVKKVNTMQAVIAMAAPTVNYTDITNYTGMLLASQIFGGGSLSSRLMRVIRDREGLTYGVYTTPQPEGNRTAFRMHMQVAPKNIKRAEDLFFEELDRYKKEGPSLAEVLLYQNTALNGVLFRYENGSKIANNLLYYLMRRKDVNYDLNYIQLLESYSPEDLKRIIRQTFPEHFFISVAKP